MGTVVGIESDGGAVVAGDTRVAEDGSVTSEGGRRVFDLGDVGAGATGDPGDVQAFGRRLDAALREREHDADDAVEVDVVARIASTVAEETGVEAVVAARDGEGVARVRRVGPDGGVLEGPTVALGSGAAVALGRLAAADLAVDVAATEALAREILAAVAQRDAETGSDLDVWTLANDDADPTSTG